LASECIPTQVYEQIRHTMNASPMGIVWYDASRDMVDCNEEALHICNAANKEELGRYFLQPQYGGAAAMQTTARLFDEAERQGRATLELTHFDANQAASPVEVTMTRLPMANGEASHFLAYVQDISARIAEKTDNLAKVQAMELTRMLLDNTPVLIELWEEDGTKCIGCNKYLLDTFGLASEAEFTGDWEKFSAPIQSCGTPASVLNPYWITKATREGFSSGDWLFILPNGEELPAHSTWVKIVHYGRPMIIVYSIDLRPIRAAMQSEENSKAKSRFLARMSHEIRTPLSAVLSISELQLRGQQLSAQTEEAFAKIYDSSKTLLHIVNDILDFSKIESGKLSLLNKEYDVAGLVSDTAQLHFVYAERKNIAFTLHVDENLPAQLIGDVLRIRQIITNLLTNAFKYTESGSVSLTLHSETADDATRLVITIQDTGIGMNATQINELRGEYVRLHEQSKPFVSGTGLGIPIVYSLSHMMNAQFELTSAVNKGTKAVVRIPQEKVGTATLGKATAHSLENFEAKNWSFRANDFAFTPTPVPRGHILVVDDVDTNLYIAEAMLQSFNQTVDLCESAQQALDKINAGQQYDIIFLDYMMPRMNGVELTKILRSTGYTRPIIALTANAVKGEAEMFMQNGFSGFMSKPIDIKLLNSYLLRFLTPTN